MLGLRCILCVMDSQTHKPWVLENAGVSRSLLEAVKTRKLHLLWTYHEETRQPEEGHYNYDCTRKTGKRQPKTSWMNNITAWTGLALMVY